MGKCHQFQTIRRISGVNWSPDYHKWFLSGSWPLVKHLFGITKHLRKMSSNRVLKHWRFIMPTMSRGMYFLPDTRTKFFFPIIEWNDTFSSRSSDHENNEIAYWLVFRWALYIPMSLIDSDTVTSNLVSRTEVREVRRLCVEGTRGYCVCVTCLWLLQLMLFVPNIQRSYHVFYRRSNRRKILHWSIFPFWLSFINTSND